MKMIFLFRIFLFRIFLLLLLLSLYSCTKDSAIPVSTKVKIDSSGVMDNCKDLPPSSNFTGYEYFFPNFSFNSPCFSPNISTEIVFRKKNMKNLSEPDELWRVNILTGESNLLLKNVWFQPKWGKNNWIVFNRSDRNIWKIKSNGDSLIQLTFQNENYSPEWNFNGSQIVYRKVIDSKYYLVIMAEDGHAIDSFPNVIYSNGSWSENNNKIATIFSTETGHDISYFDITTKQLIQVTQNSFAENSSKNLVSAMSWLNEETILWSNGYGIFKTDINSKNTYQLKSACTSKYYLWPSISIDKKNLIIDRVTKSIIGDNKVSVNTEIVSINFDFNDESVVKIN